MLTHRKLNKSIWHICRLSLDLDENRAVAAEDYGERLGQLFVRGAFKEAKEVNRLVWINQT